MGKGLILLFLIIEIIPLSFLPANRHLVFISPAFLYQASHRLSETADVSLFDDERSLIQRRHAARDGLPDFIQSDKSRLFH